MRTYYAAVIAGDQAKAQQQICSAQQTTWLTHHLNGVGDLERGITYATHEDPVRSGISYLVVVELRLGVRPAAATLTLVPEDGTYRICGGTA